MAEGLYIYESHLGGLYTSPYPLDDDALYCDTCGDWDMELGFAESRAEARKILTAQRLYTNAYIREFVRKNFPKEEDDG